jgi:hypothetical protein
MSFNTNDILLYISFCSRSARKTCNVEIIAINVTIILALSPVLWSWIGIVLMPIRIQIFILMWIQVRIRSRIGITTMPIHSGSYPKFYTSGKIWGKFNIIHSYASLLRFSYLIRAKCVMILNILDNFSRKNRKYMSLELMRIRSGRIRQNDADPTRSGSGSGSTTLALPHNFCAHFFLFQGRGIVPALWLRPSLLSGLVQGCRATIFESFPSKKFHFNFGILLGTKLSRKSGV